MPSVPNQDDPTTRILSLTSITSAPASRISSTASSSTPASTCDRGSEIRIRMPGPVAGAVPARIDSSSIRCSASSRATRWVSAPDLQLGPGLLQLGDLVLQPARLGAQTVQQLDQVLAAGVGVGVVGGVAADLHHPAETDDEQDHGGDDLSAPGMQQRRAAAALAGRRPPGVAAGVVRVLGDAGLSALAAAQRSQPPRYRRYAADGRAAPSAQAWISARRIAATLVKMRMPSTTTTAVDSWEPTPIWSPT